MNATTSTTTAAAARPMSTLADYTRDIPRHLRDAVSCGVERCSAGHAKRHAGPCVPAVRCNGPQCEARLLVPNVPHDRLAARLEAEGWTAWEGRWYCGKRCRDVERARLTMATKKADDRGHAAITRVSVDDVERGGEVTRWIVCDLFECEARIKVRVDADGDAAAKLATAAGFVQYDFGTFCSHDHARKARANILAGRQAPILDPDAPREVDDAPPPAIALAPEPTPPPERASLHTQVPASPASTPLPASVVPPAATHAAPVATAPPRASQLGPALGPVSAAPARPAAPAAPQPTKRHR